MATTTLTLHFDVTGTAVTLANVRSFARGIEAAANSVTGGWTRAADHIERSLSRINGRITTLSAIGTAAAVGGLYKLTEAFTSLGRASVMVNQQFQEFEITLSSSLKSADSARKIVQEVAKITAYSPIPFKDIAASVTGLSVLPQLNARFVNQAQNDELGDTKGLLRRSVRLVEMMTAFRPDKNPEDALFSIREALAGEFRSIQRRFDVPLSIFTNASGLSMPQLKERGPDAIFDALFKAFDNIVSSQAITAKAKLPTVAIENLWEQIFEQPSLAVGRAGFNRTLNERLYSYLERATLFFTTNPEIPESGKFVKDGFAQRISTAASKMFTRLANIAEGMIDGILRSLGYKEGSMFERASAAVADAFEYIASSLPRWYETIRHIFEEVTGVLKKIWEFVKPALQFLGDRPQLAALTALIGPRNIVNAGLATALHGLPTLLGSSGIVGGSFMAGAGRASSAYRTAYSEVMDPNRYFPMTDHGRRITKTGADLLNVQGYRTRADLPYRAGSFIGETAASTALATGQGLMAAQAMKAGHSAAAVSALESMAGAGLAAAKMLGQLALLGGAMWFAFNRLQELTKQFVGWLEDKRIAREASENQQMIPKKALEPYLGQSQGVAEERLKYLTKIDEALKLSEEAPEDEARLASLAKAAEALGVRTKFYSSSFDPDQNIRLPAQLNWTDPVTGVTKRTEEELRALLLTRYQKLGTEFVAAAKAALEGAKGNESAQQKAERLFNNVEATINEIKDLPDAATILEKRFGFAEFRAILGNIGQLASTRLSQTNLEFTENFVNKTDPMLMLRKNIEEYLKTYRSVSAGIEAMAKKVEQLDNKAFAGYIQGNIIALEEYIASGAKDEVVVNGVPHSARNLLKQMQDALKQAVGRVFEPYAPLLKYADGGIKETSIPLYRDSVANRFAGSAGNSPYPKITPTRDLARGMVETERQNMAENQETNVVAAFLRANRGFAEVTKKLPYGPSFDREVESFQKTLGSVQSLAFNNSEFIEQLEKLKELAPGLRFDSSSMNDLEKFKALKIHLQTLRQFEEASIRALESLGKTTGGLESTQIATETLRGSLVEFETQTRENEIALTKLLENVSLNKAYQNALTQEEILDTARERKMRVSTDDRRMARANTAMTADIRGLESFEAGFKSQFLVGDDFMNFAREGIALAGELDKAFSDALGNIVMGTESVEEAFRKMASGILESMARLFAQKAVAIFLTKMIGAGVSSGSSTASTDASNPFDTLATGGFIGKGSGTKDDVPALLMKGEYVLNKKAVDMIGRDNLDAWNFGRAKGMATGGSVGSDYSLPELSANTVQNQYHFGDVVYNSKGGQGGPGNMTADEVRSLQRQHKAMTIQLIEEHDRRKRRAGM